jgi:hypothetical protein
VKRESFDVDLVEARRVVEHAALDEAEKKLLLAVIELLGVVIDLVATKSTTIARLKKMIFGARTEKTSQVCGDKDQEGRPPAAAAKQLAAADKPKRKGHGRNPAAHYPGAEKISVAHPKLSQGDSCPCCDKGKVRGLEPAKLMRIGGKAPIWSKLYELDRLRCNTCGETFTASAPDGAGETKYDVTVAVMIAVMKYGLGLPFHRLARMQSAVGVPLPAATQWDVLCAHLRGPEAAYDELIRQAALAEVLHNDDTTMKVLSLPLGDSRETARERTGVFTTGIVACAGERHIVLFFTGTQHAGENLRDVLRLRDPGLAAPIQMCDALSRNLPKGIETVLANCMSHSRRRYVDVFNYFPDECRHVLETLRDVYRNDATARKRKLTAEERLAWHQQESAPLMTKLEKWLHVQFDSKLVEPNSTLGDAISYMLDHWHALTQFLRVPGAPLDNNICERALKKAILHRKNSLFFRTERGAHAGDVFLSLIHTAELCGENPIDYLTALMLHANEVVVRPGDWLPWNYAQAAAVAA